MAVCCRRISQFFRQILADQALKVDRVDKQAVRTSQTGMLYQSVNDIIINQKQCNLIIIIYQQYQCVPPKHHMQNQAQPNIQGLKSLPHLNQASQQCHSHAEDAPVDHSNSIPPLRLHSRSSQGNTQVWDINDIADMCPAESEQILPSPINQVGQEDKLKEANQYSSGPNLAQDNSDLQKEIAFLKRLVQENSDEDGNEYESDAFMYQQFYSSNRRPSNTNCQKPKYQHYRPTKHKSHFIDQNDRDDLHSDSSGDGDDYSWSSYSEDNKQNKPAYLGTVYEQQAEESVSNQSAGHLSQPVQISEAEQNKVNEDDQVKEDQQFIQQLLNQKDDDLLDQAVLDDNNSEELLSPLASETSSRPNKRKSKARNHGKQSDASAVLSMINKKFEDAQKIIKMTSKRFGSEIKSGKYQRKNVYNQSYSKAQTKDKKRAQKQLQLRDVISEKQEQGTKSQNKIEQAMINTFQSLIGGVLLQIGQTLHL